MKIMTHPEKLTVHHIFLLLKRDQIKEKQMFSSSEIEQKRIFCVIDWSADSNVQFREISGTTEKKPSKSLNFWFG